MKKLLTLSLLMSLAISSFGQSREQKTWLAVTLDNNQYGPLFNQPVERVFKTDNPSFSIGVDHYLNSFFNLSTAISMGKICDYTTDLEHLAQNNQVRSNLVSASVSGTFKLNNGRILAEKSRLAPFFEAGIGLAYFNEGVMEKDNGSSISIPLAAGLTYRFTDNFQLVAKVGENRNAKSKFKRFSFGFSFAINGRPDSDNDGLFDDEDACPEEFGEKDNYGCPYPDTDGDGVLDMYDECPLTYGTLLGCPDSDGDGIRNSEDKCPDVAGLKNFSGCADTDGDGVQDSLDPCPDKAGTDGGCPKIELPIQVVYFKFASASVEDLYHEKLAALAQIVKENPDIFLTISGFTDNVDSDYTNNRLSKARAESVKEFLLSAGIRKGNIITHGFGEQNPLADNGSVVGRARNRRVEIQFEKRRNLITKK